jgi:hypothetical protein
MVDDAPISTLDGLMKGLVEILPKTRKTLSQTLISASNKTSKVMHVNPKHSTVFL